MKIVSYILVAVTLPFETPIPPDLPCLEPPPKYLFPPRTPALNEPNDGGTNLGHLG